MFEQKAAPFVTNEQKDRAQQQYQQQTNYQQAPKGEQPLFNMQIYKPPVQKDSRNISLDPSKFIMSTVPGPYFPPQYTSGVAPYMWGTQSMGNHPMNIYKMYNINTGGVTDNHVKLSFLYEDVMPTKNFNTSPNTIGERMTMHDFVRSTMFDKGDGVNTDMSGKSQDSFMNRIKLADLNPYNRYRFSSNPYRGLPRNMLIYRMCYPIKHEPTNNTVSCAKTSTGMNIRVYKLTDAAYESNKTRGSDLMNYDPWRELAYYEFVREQIIKTKQSPNFVSMYGFYLSDNCLIDFDKILEMQGYPSNRQPQYILKKQTGANGVITNVNLKNPEYYSGKSMVVLTESPLYHLFGWSSKTYKMDGNVKTMVQAGFYDVKVWMSVLFQIMVSLYIMQTHGIVFNNYSVDNNIYIKDLNQHGNSVSYWKYKIDGIDYYIPNYGYLVMFDTSYMDVKSSTSILPGSTPRNKIIGSMFGDTISISDARNNVFEHFKQTFNTNIFDQNYVNEGGVKPPGDVMRLLEKIMNVANTDAAKDIGMYIFRYMRHFMHNRVGTFLRETEVFYIRKSDVKDFIRGQIIVYEEAANTYKFVLFNGELRPGVMSILTKRDLQNEIIDITVPLSSLYQYSKIEPIVQNFKANEANLGEDDLLETYIFNKN